MKSVLHAAARQADLKPFEYPLAVLLEPRPWTKTEEVVIADMTAGGVGRSIVGLVTLTGKPKRLVLQTLYRPAIVALDKFQVCEIGNFRGFYCQITCGEAHVCLAMLPQILFQEIDAAALDPSAHPALAGRCDVTSGSVVVSAHNSANPTTEVPDSGT